MNKINILANIARNYRITESGKLRDDIVSEYIDILESLDIIEESIINHDISLLPVYKINESTSTITKNQHSKAVQIAKKLLNNKYKHIKSAFREEKYNPRDSFIPFLYYEVDSLNLKTRDELMEFGNDATMLSRDIQSELAKNGVYVNMDMDGTTSGFIYMVNKSYNEETKLLKEGYAIDLDSLKYVVESKEINIENAIQEIRDINYIGDTIPMYCVLPKDINERMSLESFLNLNDVLNKYNITPIAIREYFEEEFIKKN